MEGNQQSGEKAGPVTMAMIAREAGLSRSAVSYALRNHPSIPESTCQRVQKLAAKMGYRPNAYISTLMAQVQRRQIDGKKPTIGWLVDSALGAPILQAAFYKNVLKGARERADQLGFTLQTFRCNDGKMTSARLGKVLRSRGIHGLVVGPVSNQFSADSGKFPFNDFACSTIGYSLRQPVLHRIGIDFSQGMQLVWDKILESGYTRPGLLLASTYDERTNYQLRAMYMALQSSTEAVVSIPPCLFDGKNLRSAVVQNWITQFQPDAFLCPNFSGIVETLADFAPQSSRPALFLINHDQTLPFPGIIQPEIQLGVAATDLVVGQIHRNEKGIPGTPNLTLIPYAWYDPQQAQTAQTRPTERCQ